MLRFVIMMITNESMPAFYIPHGGGPCFFMDQDFGPPGTWDKMAAHLRGISRHVPQKPRAIVMISAHWETRHPTIQSTAQPGMLYDYYGFPEHTYHLQYPAPGAPQLALQIHGVLQEQGFTPSLDDERGFDHGTFIPLMLMYPQADIPVLQVSLQQDLDPDAHYRLGQALAPLRQQGVLLVGSGLSYHNLRDFFSDSPRAVADAVAFDQWLVQAVTQPHGHQRRHSLNHWAAAPGARGAHPREEHLLPLMVIAGSGYEGYSEHIYSDTILNKPVSSFIFQSTPV